MAINKIPPEAAQNNAKRGLELRKKYNRGGLSASEASEQGLRSGVNSARSISSGNALSTDLIKAMARFNRFRKDYQPDKRESDGGQTAGTIAWLLWGGTTGVDWALKKSQEIDDEKKALDEIEKKVSDKEKEDLKNKEKEHNDIPILIVIDEVHQFYKSSSSKGALGDLDVICRVGRSKKIGVVFSSQNINDIPNGLTSVINTKFMFKTDEFGKKINGISPDDIQSMKSGYCLTNIHGLPQLKLAKFPLAKSGVL